MQEAKEFLGAAKATVMDVLHHDLVTMDIHGWREPLRVGVSLTTLHKNAAAFASRRPLSKFSGH